MYRGAVFWVGVSWIYETFGTSVLRKQKPGDSIGMRSPDFCLVDIFADAKSIYFLAEIRYIAMRFDMI